MRQYLSTSMILNGWLKILCWWSTWSIKSSLSMHQSLIIFIRLQDRTSYTVFCHLEWFFVIFYFVCLLALIEEMITTLPFAHHKRVEQISSSSTEDLCSDQKLTCRYYINYLFLSLCRRTPNSVHFSHRSFSQEEKSHTPPKYFSIDPKIYPIFFRIHQYIHRRRVSSQQQQQL